MTADTEFRLSLGHGKRVRPFLLLLVLCTLCSALFSAAAFAASHQQVSVLIVDAGLGDVETFSSNWLGSAVETSAADGARALLSTTHPSWWNGADAPATFLLHNTAAGALTSEDIVWALDAIAASGACPKTVVVALGATGLQARVYAEDLGTTLQSRRADLVGLILLGTPNSGLSMQQTYPQLKLWAPYAAGAGFAPEDLVPGSTLLTSLDAGRFPSILKSLTIRGAAEDLGFGMTDGATVQPDLVLSQAAEVLSDETVVRATLSSGSDLTAYWMPATRKGGEKLNEVNEKAVAKLNAIRSYAAEPAVRAAVKEFYQAWFSEGAPVTHVSTVLTLDISGSMDQKLQSGKTKLAAAKTAAGDFLKSVQARGGQALAVPEDIEVIGFDTETKTIATGADDAAIKAVKAITTGGNTDVGKAIQKSLDALTSSPPAAEKHIVFLSDGLSTEGKSEKKILSGPVTKAKKSGVVIDTVAFGKVGQSDVAFLKKIAKETGGTFFQPTDV
jgi:Mg-chelatase subunit ChlD